MPTCGERLSRNPDKRPRRLFDNSDFSQSRAEAPNRIEGRSRRIAISGSFFARPVSVPPLRRRKTRDARRAAAQLVRSKKTFAARAATPETFSEPGGAILKAFAPNEAGRLSDVLRLVTQGVSTVARD